MSADDAGPAGARRGQLPRLSRRLRRADRSPRARRHGALLCAPHARELGDHREQLWRDGGRAWRPGQLVAGQVQPAADLHDPLPLWLPPVGLQECAGRGVAAPHHLWARPCRTRPPILRRACPECNLLLHVRAARRRRLRDARRSQGGADGLLEREGVERTAAGVVPRARHPALELRGLLALSVLQGAHAAQAAPVPPLPPGCLQRPVLYAEGGRQHGLQESRPGGVLAHESGFAASLAGKYFCGRPDGVVELPRAPRAVC
mmetsp:Transcript_39935/g.128402  ORF Transcript_39935/g.128402 Transcript_39935/m.128402 type:complete len:261 (-) Transcript_39935:141-923(-)